MVKISKEENHLGMLGALVFRFSRSYHLLIHQQPKLGVRGKEGIVDIQYGKLQIKVHFVNDEAER